MISANKGDEADSLCFHSRLYHPLILLDNLIKPLLLRESSVAQWNTHTQTDRHFPLILRFKNTAFEGEGNHNVLSLSIKSQILMVLT